MTPDNNLKLLKNIRKGNYVGIYKRYNFYKVIYKATEKISYNNVVLLCLAYTYQFKQFKSLYICEFPKKHTSIYIHIHMHSHISIYAERKRDGIVIYGNIEMTSDIEI